MRELRPLGLLLAGIGCFLLVRWLVLAMGIDLGKVGEAPAPVVAAFIGVVGVITTVLGSVLVWRLRENRAEAHRRREQSDRIRNMAAALRSEVTASLDRLRLQFDPLTNDALLRGMRANLEAAHATQPPGRGLPTGVAMGENTIYDTHGRDIFFLPEEVMHAIVRYYQNDAYLTRYVEAMATGRFDHLPLRRQRRAVLQLMDLGEQTLRAAILARAFLVCFQDPTDTPGIAHAVAAILSGVVASGGDEQIDYAAVWRALEPARRTDRLARLERLLGLNEAN